MTDRILILDFGSQVTQLIARRVREAGVYCEILPFNVDPARKYYDSTTHPHHHFYNVDSGALTDIPADQIRIRDLPALPEGTEQQGVEVLIRVRDKR